MNRIAQLWVYMGALAFLEAYYLHTLPIVHMCTATDLRHVASGCMISEHGVCISEGCYPLAATFTASVEKLATGQPTNITIRYCTGPMWHTPQCFFTPIVSPASIYCLFKNNIV